MSRHLHVVRTEHLTKGSQRRIVLYPSRGEPTVADSAHKMRSPDMRAIALPLAALSMILLLAFISLALHPSSLCGGMSAGNAEIRCPLLF